MNRFTDRLITWLVTDGNWVTETNACVDGVECFCWFCLFTDCICVTVAIVCFIEVGSWLLDICCCFNSFCLIGCFVLGLEDILLEVVCLVLVDILIGDIDCFDVHGCCLVGVILCDLKPPWLGAWFLEVELKLKFKILVY